MNKKTKLIIEITLVTIALFVIVFGGIIINLIKP
jgi:hypothetical protein